MSPKKNEKNQQGEIITFVGPETFQLREHVRQYIQAAEQKYGDFNVSKIDPEDANFETFKSELLSPPFLGSGKRVFFLDQFPLPGSEKMSAEKKELSEKILAIFYNIPTEVVVICICENPDRRMKIWKELSKMANPEISREFPEPKEEQLTRWVLKMIEQRKGKILPAAAEYLWQYVGANLWNLAHEIEKLVNYSSEKPVSERDIREVCEPNFETIQFALANAFATGNEEEVSAIFHRMVDGGHSALTLLIRDFGSIMRQFLLVRYALDTKKSAREIDMNPFIFGRVKNIAARFSGKHLRAMHEKLVEIDEGAKTGVIPVSGGKQDLLVFALERWIREFFEVEETIGQ